MSYYVMQHKINSFSQKVFTPFRRKIGEGKVFGENNLVPTTRSLRLINEIVNREKSESTILGLDSEKGT